MNDIASFFVSLFQGSKLSGRWIALILLLIFLLGGFWEYERLSGHFYLGRLEAKITMLKDLQAIADRGIDNHPELQPAYVSAIEDLNSFDVSIPFFPNFNLTTVNAIGKAISGAFIWILILIVGVSIEIGKVHKITGMIMLLIIVLLLIAALFAWLGTLIPTLLNPWVNYLGFPIIQGIILWLLFRKRKKPSS